MSGSGGCGTSGFVGSISAGMEAVCGCRVRICGRADCSGSVLWETWSFCCSRTVSRVRMTGENVSESVIVFVLIGLMQLGARCSDGSCEAAEDLIAGFSAIEAEAELV